MNLIFVLADVQLWNGNLLWFLHLQLVDGGIQILLTAAVRIEPVLSPDLLMPRVTGARLTDDARQPVTRRSNYPLPTIVALDVGPVQSDVFAIADRFRVHRKDLPLRLVSVSFSRLRQDNGAI